jgi:hypothetical protein
MLVLKRPILNREYILINTLKVSALIISMCNLHVTFLSKITPRYFTLFTNRMFHPFSVRWDSGSQRLRKVSFLSQSQIHIATDSQSVSQSVSLGPRNIPGLSYQLLTATAHNN